MKLRLIYFDKSNSSATLAMTSDYVYRGISYTGDDPAVQSMKNILWSVLN